MKHTGVTGFLTLLLMYSGLTEGKRYCSNTNGILLSHEISIPGGEVEEGRGQYQHTQDSLEIKFYIPF